MGPLVARWRTVEHEPVQAGRFSSRSLEVENAGSAPWRTRGHEDGLFLAYHWLDERGNPIVWDGLRTELERVVEPGETLEQPVAIRAPIPPGRYGLALDFVEEHRFWLAELGERRRSRRRSTSRRATRPALRSSAPSPTMTWLAAAAELHREGYSAVGGAIEARGFATTRAGGGRNPRFAHPLVCPSLLPPLEPNTEVERLPAYAPEARRAFDVRRPARAQTSIAIWSSTRVKTNAPSASDDDARDDEVERVRPVRQRAREERRAHRLDRRRERIHPVDDLDRRAGARERRAGERVEDRRQEEPAARAAPRR